MERRVLLAITLSFLVLFLFQRFVMPPPGARAGRGAGSCERLVGARSAGCANADGERDWRS